jgi:hypothetical protein
MKPLKDLCFPRDSVFDIARRDTVLNLTHLTAEKITAKDFFEENYVTEGMKTLLTEAFRRLQKKSEQAVFKLTQAMGGGKTHNLITLGMLAKNPEFRAQVLKDLPDAQTLPPVRVVAFSGRETDVPHGIWGEIARQLEKQDAFKDYYSPLKAPGRTAWINLLKGEPTLILLDELPPYLDNAKSVAVHRADESFRSRCRKRTRQRLRRADGPRWHLRRGERANRRRLAATPKRGAAPLDEPDAGAD